MNDTASESPVKDIRWIDKTAIVDVMGDIDLHRSLAFQRALLDVLDSKPERMVVNLSKVSYMDSSGVASLVKLLSHVRRIGVSMRLAAMTDRVRNVFEITRLDTIFEIYPTEEEAIA